MNHITGSVIALDVLSKHVKCQLNWMHM